MANRQGARKRIENLDELDQHEEEVVENVENLEEPEEDEEGAQVIDISDDEEDDADDENEEEEDGEEADDEDEDDPNEGEAVADPKEKPVAYFQDKIQPFLAGFVPSPAGKSQAALEAALAAFPTRDHNDPVFGTVIKTIMAQMGAVGAVDLFNEEVPDGEKFSYALKEIEQLASDIRKYNVELAGWYNTTFKDKKKIAFNGHAFVSVDAVASSSSGSGSSTSSSTSGTRRRRSSSGGGGQRREKTNDRRPSMVTMKAYMESEGIVPAIRLTNLNEERYFLIEDEGLVEADSALNRTGNTVYRTPNAAWRANFETSVNIWTVIEWHLGNGSWAARNDIDVLENAFEYGVAHGLQSAG